MNIFKMDYNNYTGSIEKDKHFMDWRDYEPRIKDVITMLKDDGGYDDLLAYRANKAKLKRHFDNAFNSDVSLTAATNRTDIFRSPLARIVVTIMKRKMSIPTFDVEPVNKSRFAYDQKTMASQVKSGLEWFMRITSYESIKKESREAQVAYGDGRIQPYIRAVGDKIFPALQDTNDEDLIIDPNCKQLRSESYCDQAQYWAATRIYSEKAMKSRFGGDWILDYAQPGWMIDNKRYLEINKIKNRGKSTKFYEVLEIQDKATGEEWCLAGQNAFPAIAVTDGYDMKAPNGDVKKLLADENVPIVWSNEYKYKNSLGERILTLTGNFMFNNPDSPRNWGVLQEVSILQVIDEITQNLKMDNIIQRLDKTVYLVGGSPRTDEARLKYRQQRKSDRHAVWNIPSSIASKITPVPGVLEYGGMTAQEGQQVTDDIMNIAKNITGVDPRQLEVQKNTAVTQTQIIEEKSTEAIEDIMESNVPQFEIELKTFLAFMIAHEGFGLTDVKVNFTKYSKDFPEGDENATLTIAELCKQIKDFEYNVIIDRSTLIKRSRFLEAQGWQELLQTINPQFMPEWYKFVMKQIAYIKGLTLPDVKTEQIQQSTPMGGASQFSGATPPTQGGMPAPTEMPMESSVPNM